MNEFKKGDIMIAKTTNYSDSDSNNIYRELNMIQGKEYECLGTYYCNGLCVYFYPEEGGCDLGISANNFTLKR